MSAPRKQRLVVLALTVLEVAGCGTDVSSSSAPAVAGPHATTPEGTSAAVPSAIARAEYSRMSSGVSEGALRAHDPRVRRAAARALARIADGRAIDLLGKSLSDEDDEVIAWSAYGLGFACAGREVETVRTLVARATWLGGVGPPPDDEHALAVRAMSAIADALGRCGSGPAEQTLRAWLDGPEQRVAALALGRLAGHRHRLDDGTVVALLDAAGRPEPLPAALHAVGQLESLSVSGQKRLLEVAGRAVTGGGAGRSFAVRALLRAGLDAAPLLVGVLTDEHAPTSDRSAAATALGRLGPGAAAALSTAIARLVPEAAVLDEPWLPSAFGPLGAALTALGTPSDTAAAALARLADLPISEHATAAVRRRVVALRCGAAVALAGSAIDTPRLARCDPDAHGRAGALALLRVLDRSELVGVHLDAWTGFAKAQDPAVRRAAFQLLPRHPEAAPVASLLVQALAAREPGVVAEAARVLADAPRLASDAPRPSQGAPRDGAPETAGAEPSPAVVEALAHAMDAERPPDQIETRMALASAAAALAVLSLKPRIERYCRSSNVALRRSAELALRRLGSGNASCAAPSGGTPVPDVTAERRRLTLTFVTDAGRLGLTLDPAVAPLSVGRIAELARSGFYDRIEVHRVTPGFVVQLGDPVGDGSGGSGRPPLPSETSPLEFGSLAVGLALGGRDTGSSQIFVTLAAEPDLYGDYPLLGWADPEWAAVAEGDVIRGVEVHE